MCCGRGCAGVGAQNCPFGLHALRGLRAAGVAGGRPRGGWPATVVRGVWCQALSLPRPPILWGGQPGFRDPCVPGAVGTGVGTQHRPHSERPCGPALRAVGVAGGRHPRGMPVDVVRGVGGQALPLPRLPALRAGCRGPPPTCCGRGCAGVGAQHCPLGLHALWGLRAAGVLGGRPRGGWPATVVTGVWCQALSLPRLPVLWGRQLGFRDPCVPAALGAGLGTQHRPRSVRPHGPALCAVGVAEGRPRGSPFRRCEGRLRSGAPPPPSVRPPDGQLGYTTHVLWARSCGCGGPALSPWLACPVETACRGGGGGPSLGGGACTRCEGRLVSGAVPPAAAHPLGLGAGFARPVCPRCGWCGRGDPAPAPQRAPLRAGVARCGGGGRASSGGGCLSPLCGASKVRRSPSSDCPPSGRAVGVRHLRAVGGGVRVWEPSTVPLACMPCGGCVSRGWWGAVPGGGWPATVVRGVWCQVLSLPRPLVLWGWQPGFRDPCVPGAVGAGLGTQHQPHGVRPCGPALRAVGVAEGRPRGGGAFRRCEGRLRSGAPPPPTARPPGELSGSAIHLL